MRKSKIPDGFAGRLPMVALIVLLLAPITPPTRGVSGLAIAAFAQEPQTPLPITKAGKVNPVPRTLEKGPFVDPTPIPATQQKNDAPRTISDAPTAPAVPAPIEADSELLLIFQAHRVTSQLIDERLKASGIPELQQELRVLQARFEAWKRAKNVPPGWVWSDERKQFESPAAAPGPPPSAPGPQPQATKKP